MIIRIEEPWEECCCCSTVQQRFDTLAEAVANTAADDADFYLAIEVPQAEVEQAFVAHRERLAARAAAAELGNQPMSAAAAGQRLVTAKQAVVDARRALDEINAKVKADG